MSVKTFLFSMIVFQAILGLSTEVFGATSAFGAEAGVRENADCVICLIPTAADEVCACQGVKDNKKARNSCTLFFECSGGQRQDILVGDEANMCGGHYFHVACLRGWVEQGNGCPVCRKTFSPDERMLLWRDLLYSTPSLSQASVTGNLLQVKKYLRRGSL